MNIARSDVTLEGLKKKIDRLKNVTPITLITGKEINAEIIEEYKGFKIRRWTRQDQTIYDTAYST